MKKNRFTGESIFGTENSYLEKNILLIFKYGKNILFVNNRSRIYQEKRYYN